MGRKPKPTAVKRLEGNPGKRPLNTQEPEYPVGLMDAPPNLDEVGRQEWLRVGNLLCKQRVLTEADFTVLAVYCWSFQKWMQLTDAITTGAEEMTTTSPNGMVMTSAAMTNQKMLQTQMMKAMVELGLTPSSRSKIKSGDEKQNNEMEKLLEG